MKRFEWFFIERRRWEDPVDTWLNSKEVSVLGQYVGRLSAVPMNQTTKGLMRQWQALKNANDDDSGDIGYEQLQQLLRVCRIRAPEAEVKRIFNSADEDGSGSIDSVEFLSIVRSLQEAGGSSGVEACTFIRALHGPSEALAVVLACTHKSVLESAGSSSRQECMFHVEIDENETRPCDIRVHLLKLEAFRRVLAPAFIFMMDFLYLCKLSGFFRHKRQWILFVAARVRRWTGLQVADMPMPWMCWRVLFCVM